MGFVYFRMIAILRLRTSVGYSVVALSQRASISVTIDHGALGFFHKTHQQASEECANVRTLKKKRQNGAYMPAKLDEYHRHFIPNWPPKHDLSRNTGPKPPRDESGHFHRPGTPQNVSYHRNKVT